MYPVIGFILSVNNIFQIVTDQYDDLIWCQLMPPQYEYIKGIFQQFLL